MIQRPPIDHHTSSVMPFRPPKSPSSSVIAKNAQITPKSPPATRRRRFKVLPQDWDKHKRDQDDASSSVSKALSPTSVVDSKGVFPRRKKERSSNESDRSLVDAGNACLKDGNQVGALFAYEILLDERVRRYGPRHVLVGTAMNDLGMVHLHFGEFKPAEKLFARSAALQNRSKKANPLNVVASLVNLGQARLKLGKRHAAGTVFHDAVRILRTKLGEDHERVPEIQCQIGYLLFEAGEMSTALDYFVQALAIYRAGDEMNTLHQVAMSETLCNIGSIHLEQKDFDAAVDCFLEALQIQRYILGDWHPTVIVTLDNLAFAHTKKRDYEKALKYYNETLQAQVAFYGEYNEMCAETKRKEQLVFKKYCSSRRSNSRDRAMTA